MGPVAFLVAACGTMPPARDTRLRADDHYELARQNDEQARQQLLFPDPLEPGAQEMRYMPYRASQSPEELLRIASAHRAVAAAMAQDFEQACGSLPFGEVSSSPLRRYVLVDQDSTNALKLFMRGELAPEALANEIRCHRAWLLVVPARATDDSALDLPDLDVSVRRMHEGLLVVITPRDPDQLPELRRRFEREQQARTMHP